MENKYVKLLVQNLSHVILGLLVLLLGVVFYLQSHEGGDEIDVPARAAVSTPDPILPVKEVDAVNKELAVAPPIDQTHIGQVKQFDMFDVQAVQDIQARQQKAQELFTQADALAKAGKLQDALDKLEEIFKIYPPDIDAKKLRNQIQEELAKEEAAKKEKKKPGGAAATPAAPGQ